MSEIRDIFATDPEREAQSRTMNRMIVASARRGERYGTLARLAGAPALESDTPPQERLNRLLADREAAMTSGDADALAVTEHRIDRLFEDVRAGRSVGDDPPRASNGRFARPEPLSFDGGVQGRRGPPPPGAYAPQQTAGELFLAAMLQSHLERLSADDDERRIAANY